MKKSLLLLVSGFLLPLAATAQFAPEININLGIQSIPSGSYDKSIEPDNTLMYEAEIYHPFFKTPFFELKIGIDGSLRKKSEAIALYDCTDCGQYSFEANSMGPSLKLTSTKTKILFSLYSGLNFNSLSFQQTSYGYIPSDLAMLTPLKSGTERYLNVDGGIRLGFPVASILSFTFDARVYTPVDDNPYNNLRTSLGLGISAKF